MAEFLDEKHREFTDRLNELKPLAEEYARLEAVVAVLDGRGVPTAAPAAPVAPKAARNAAPKAPGRRGPGRPRGSKTRVAGAAATVAPAAPAARGGARRKLGRPKGSGSRQEKALSFVTAQPGITIPELAARMGIEQTYVRRRLLPTLEQVGKVAKRGQGWHPKS